jgi:multidrug efflux pump subunit AcrB
MNRVIAWFARNGVAANLLMLLIIAGGTMTVLNLQKEVFPEIDTDMITVTVPYLGAAPEEVEEAVCVRVEEAIQDLQGIKQLTSSADEGVGTVTVEVEDGYDTRELLDDIKARVDAIDTFPAETERPVVQEVLLTRKVLSVSVSGPADEKTLKSLGERVRDDIISLPGITQVSLANARPYEVSIEVSEDALRRHGLRFDDVARAVRRSSLDLPGGSVRTEGGEILLRTKGQAYRKAEFERIPVISRADGTYLTVGELATVVDGFAETDQSARFDGQPSVLVQVSRVGDQDALHVARSVHEYVEEARGRVPEGIRLDIWDDDSEVLKSRIAVLVKNGLGGLFLVILVLALFLRVRLALWVSLGIPISFLGALWLLPGLGVTINMMSLFAFIAVLGIVVDDAIVVGESIFTEQEAKGRGLVSSISGAQKVSLPVIFAVLTSVAAFGPLLMVPGNMGKIMRIIPLIVIPTLLFSLVESLLILPNHLSHARYRPRRDGAWRRLQGRIAGLLESLRDRVYAPSLRFALRWRYLTLAQGVAILLITVGLVAGGLIKFSFLPPVEADNVVALLTMPQGTPAEVTSRAIRRLERSALELQEELDARKVTDEGSIFRHVLTSVGDQPYRTRQSHFRPGADFSGAHLGEVNVELAPAEVRNISGSEIARQWRDRAGMVPDAVELTFTSNLFSAGSPIDVQLTGPDLEDLRAAAEEMKEKLAEYPGVFDIADSFRAGKREIKLDIKPAAEALGLTLENLGRQVRQAFYGEEAQRIQRGRDDIRVMVRYPAESRRSLDDLESMRIRTPGGAEVPFSMVAGSRTGRGFATIQRTDRNRSVNVTADVDLEKANANEVLADLRREFLPALSADHPGLRYTFEGEQREQKDTVMGLLRGFGIALLVIFALLAIPLGSYAQPLVIMSAIPFGLVGAAWGHVIMGINLTILSMFGIVALAGVVVNDSLVLVDLLNRYRAEGHSAAESARRAALRRFRAIVLTSATTFAGLTPLLLERSLQAQFLIPMAVSLAFGVVFSTFITLVLVPSSYLVLEDLRRLGSRLLRWYLGGSGELPAESAAGAAGRPE